MYLKTLQTILKIELIHHFVQKSYLRSNYNESNIEEDIDLKNQYRTNDLPDPISRREAALKNMLIINLTSLV